MLVKKTVQLDPSKKCLIALGDGFFATVDPDDYKRISHFRWFWKKSGSKVYAVRKKRIGVKTFLVRMHREVAQCPPDKVTHHLNRDTLDNRNHNLVNLLPYEHILAHQTGCL